MKINTRHWPPPIPDRRFDYSATWDDYDGAEDSSNRSHIGYGATEAEAIADLIDNHPRDDEPANEYVRDHGQFGVGA